MTNSESLKRNYVTFISIALDTFSADVDVDEQSDFEGETLPRELVSFPITDLSDTDSLASPCSLW